MYIFLQFVIFIPGYIHTGLIGTFLAISLNIPAIPYEQPTSDIIIFTYDETRAPKTIFNKFTSMFRWGQKVANGMIVV